MPIEDQRVEFGSDCSYMPCCYCYERSREGKREEKIAISSKARGKSPSTFRSNKGEQERRKQIYMYKSGDQISLQPSRRNNYYLSPGRMLPLAAIHNPKNTAPQKISIQPWLRTWYKTTASNLFCLLLFQLTLYVLTLVKTST